MKEMTNAGIAATLIGLTALGCAGATPPPEPSPPETSAPADSQAAVETTPDANEPADPSPEVSEPTSEPVGKMEFQAALQVVIHDESFLTALQLEEPGRFPLRIAGEGLPEGLALTAQETAVEVVPIPEDPKKDPVLVFVKIELNSKRGTFKYRYDVGGVRGTSRVANTEGRWELKSSRLSEY